jgi:hypothetical protein
MDRERERELELELERERELIRRNNKNLTLQSTIKYLKFYTFSIVGF